MKTGLRFDINPIQNNSKFIIHCEAQLIDQRIVKAQAALVKRDM